jgi:hypothetical protein
MENRKNCQRLTRRFCEMAAVTPQKRQCKFASAYPAASLVEAATSQSRWDVSGKRRTAQWNNEKRN